MSAIPIVLCIDIEPEERVVTTPSPKDDWRGFDEAMVFWTSARSMLAAATGRTVALSWFLTTDPHIGDLYGSAGWCIESRRDAIRGLECAGDEVGVHAHAWRRVDGEWLQDFADERWTAGCVRSSLDVFASRMGRPCRSFRFGDHWMNHETIDLLGALGVTHDLTTEPGVVGTLATERFRGQYPDYSCVPRAPYRPSASDFRQPGTWPGRSLWIVPISTAPLDWAVTTMARDPIAERDGMPAPGANVTGYHDRSGPDAIGGWVWDSSRPAAQMNVDILVDGARVARVGATGFRPDLLAAGIGDGRHTFRWPTPASLGDGRPHDIRVRVADTAVDLLGTPHLLRFLAPPSTGRVPILLDQEPQSFSLIFDRYLEQSDTRFLALAVRSDTFTDASGRSVVEQNLAHLSAHARASDFHFTTPADAVAMPALRSPSSATPRPARQSETRPSPAPRLTDQVP